MLRYHFVLISVVVAACFRDVLLLTPDEKQKCISEFLDWCKKNTYNTKEDEVGGSVSMYTNNNVRVYCTVDEDGTECLKDKKPWYHCFPDNTLTYQGETLQMDTTEVDDDICLAKKRAFDSGYHARFNKTAFNIQMGMFNERMNNFQMNLQRQMQNMNKRLSGFGSYW